MFREDNYVVGDMAFTVIVSLYVILVGIAGTEIQKYRNTEIQKYRNIEIQKYRIT